MNVKIQDTRTSELAEDVADRQMEQAEEAFAKGNYTDAERLRDEATFSMVRAVLLELRRGRLAR